MTRLMKGQAMEARHASDAVTRFKSHLPNSHRWRKKGIEGDFQALAHSWRGAKLAIFGRKATDIEPEVKAERPVQLQLGLAIVVWFVALYRRLPPSRMALLALSTSSVVGAEIQNAAIERLADRVTIEFDPEIRDVKDQASAAVLVRGLGALGAAVAIFWPRMK